MGGVEDVDVRSEAAVGLDAEQLAESSAESATSEDRLSCAVSKDCGESGCDEDAAAVAPKGAVGLG